MNDIAALGRRRGEAMRQRVPSYEKPQPFSGRMGRSDTDTNPAVPGRDGYVYVRLFAEGNQVMEAWSPKVMPWPNLPVLVADERATRKHMVVLDVNWDALGGPSSWGTADQNPFYRDKWVRKRQILDFHGHPTGVGLMVGVYADWFPVPTGYRYFAGGVIDLAPFIPLTASVYVTVYLTFTWNSTLGDYEETLNAIAGSPVTGGTGPGGYPANPDEGEAYLPAVPPGSFGCITFILLPSTTLLREEDAYDVRSVWNPSAFGSTPASLPSLPGQVMYSRDGVQWTSELPVTDPNAGWMVDNITGRLLVHDIP